MTKQEKLFALLAGLLITDVEDAIVLPEHRDDDLNRNPHGYDFSELVIARLVTEAKNCNLRVTVAELDDYLCDIYRIVSKVRK